MGSLPRGNEAEMETRPAVNIVIVFYLDPHYISRSDINVASTRRNVRTTWVHPIRGTVFYRSAVLRMEAEWIVTCKGFPGKGDRGGDTSVIKTEPNLMLFTRKHSLL